MAAACCDRSVGAGRRCRDDSAGDGGSGELATACDRSVGFAFGGVRVGEADGFADGAVVSADDTGLAVSAVSEVCE